MLQGHGTKIDLQESSARDLLVMSLDAEERALTWLERIQPVSQRRDTWLQLMGWFELDFNGFDLF